MRPLSKTNYKTIYITVAILSFAIWLCFVLFAGGGTPGTLGYKALGVFYLNGKEAFYDYYHSIGVASQINPYEAIPPQGQDHAYPPLAYLIYSLLRGAVSNEEILTNGIYDFNNVQLLADVPLLTVIMYILDGIFALLLFVTIKHKIKTNSLVAILITLAILVTKPVLYALERSNIILLSMLLNMFFLFYHDSKNKIIKELSLIALAISAGIKLTPAVLGVMLIYSKQWKEALRTVIYGLVAFAGPFLFFKGGFSLVPMFLNNMNEHFTSYHITNGTVYGCLQNIRKFYDFEFLHQSVKIASIICAVIIVAAVPLMKHKWQQIMALSMVLIFAPSVSQFYCLVHLVPAIIVFLGENKGEFSNATLEDKIVFTLLCIIGIMEPAMYFSAMAEILLIGYLFLISLQALIPALRRILASKFVA